MFQAFFDQAPFYTTIVSPEGRVIEAGRLALEACGYTREKVLGKLFWDTAWWRASPEVQARIKTAFFTVEKGGRFQAVLPYLMADGSDHWLDFSLSPVFDPSGTLTFVLALGTDITDRRHTEIELAANRRRLESALLAAEIGTYEWDVVSDQLHGDSNFAKLFGITFDSTGAAPLSAFVALIHPGDQARVGKAVQHSVDTGENFESDYRIVLRTGERWVTSRGRMVRDADGRVVKFFGLLIDITARKHAEQERELIGSRLRRLTSIHESVLSGINDFAYVFDLEGRFLYANRPLLALYGRPLEDVVGKTFIELGYPAWHAEMHLREIAQVIATKAPFQGEIPFRGESGQSGIFDYIFSPVFGADGRVEAVAGTTRDVTERKRGEVRDRLLVDLDDATRPLTDPAAITQASARLLAEYLGVNRCAYAEVEADENTFNLTGDFNRDVSSMVGRYRFDQFGPECLRLMRAGEPFIVTDAETDPRTEGVRESYRAAQIRSVICVPLNKAGHFVAAMAVHQNIERVWLQSDVQAVQLVASCCWESIARTRAVRELSESEQRLRLAVSTGRLGVWELDLVTRAFSASDQCLANYGRAPGTPFSYDDVLATVHPEDRPRVEATIDRAVTDGGEFDLEYRILWPDGGVHWVLVRGQTDLRADSLTRRLLGVSLDITARKQSESEQIRLREEAVRASRAKDDFLAVLSHELRTPLNPVLLLASDSANDPALSPAARASFETIRKNVELEARLIDDLLDLTSIVRGKLAIKKEFCDLHAILADAVAAVRTDFSEKSIKLELNLDPRKPSVHVDEVRLAQVFINLLKNAAKFTPHGGKVTLHTTFDGDALVVSLTDTGIGLTPSEITRVFDAFEQGEHATTHGIHRFGGLGLGLAISQRLITLHGGSIEATSEGRGRGATFTIRLPLAAVPGPAPILPPVPATAPVAESKASGARILLVEDHEGTRRALDVLLRKRKYQIVAAATLAEARKIAGKQNFDLVLSDLGLPDGDGTTLMAELRDLYGLKGVALTGYGMEEDIARCRAAGFVAHLTKPIRVEALEEALRSACAMTA